LFQEQIIRIYYSHLPKSERFYTDEDDEEEPDTTEAADFAPVATILKRLCVSSIIFPGPMSMIASMIAAIMSHPLKLDQKHPHEENLLLPHFNKGWMAFQAASSLEGST